MTTVVIGSHGTKLRLSCADRVHNGMPRVMLTAIEGPDLDASVTAYDDRYNELAVFFEDLAGSWRGWTGDRVFSSLEGEFEVVAQHDGHVTLSIRLRRIDAPGLWTLQTQVTLDPGEDLAAAARDVRALVKKS